MSAFSFTKTYNFIRIQPKCYLGYIRGTTIARGKWECLELVVTLPTRSYRDFIENCRPIVHRLYVNGKEVLTIYLYPPRCVKSNPVIRDRYKLYRDFSYDYRRSDEWRYCAWNEGKKTCVCDSDASGWLLYTFALDIYDKAIL